MDTAVGTGYHAALASPVRRRLLAVLEAGGSPLTAAELGAEVSLHVTTVRFHLEHLEQAGLVVRDAGRDRSRGRPKVRYRSSRSDPEAARQDLVGVLAEAVTNLGQSVSEQALLAGHRWASRLDTPAGDIVTAITATFTRLGFAPELAGDEIRLRSCPFRDAAREHPAVVCQVHLGLAQGLAEQKGSKHPVRVGLRPFVEPELCLITLTRDDDL
ncbi:MAG: helix-turn-helix domain-containing protein [Propionibacteriaceae bacterium]|nr:helix-turn-helix domain-containing protein [Propionibacteriaceae bacterium]